MNNTLESVTGGKEAVLAALASNPNFINARVRGEERTSIMAVGIAHELAVEKLRFDMVEALAIRLDAFISVNGARKETNEDEWDEALSDEVGKVLEPYVNALSQDWLYPHVDDSRLDRPGEIQIFAHSFAEEVWKQLTYKRSTTQILAGIGIVEGDILAFIQSYKQPKKQELHTVSQLNAVLNKIMLGFPDEATLEDYLDNASDSDETLSAGGANALGINRTEMHILQNERANGGMVEEWAFAIVEGNMLPVTDTKPQMPSLPPLPPKPVEDQPPQETVAVVPKAPEIEEALPPGVQGRKRAHVDAKAPPGTIPQETLLAFKNFGNIKDDDLALMFGVSRPTMNRYMRGKGHCVPTPTQRATLLKYIDQHVIGLQEARKNIAK